MSAAPSYLIVDPRSFLLSDPLPFPCIHCQCVACILRLVSIIKYTIRYLNLKSSNNGFLEETTIK